MYISNVLYPRNYLFVIVDDPVSIDITEFEYLR